VKTYGDFTEDTGDADFLIHVAEKSYGE